MWWICVFQCSRCTTIQSFDVEENDISDDKAQQVSENLEKKIRDRGWVKQEDTWECWKHTFPKMEDVKDEQFLELLPKVLSEFLWSDRQTNNSRGLEVG